jgi:hypothetical protein
MTAHVYLPRNASDTAGDDVSDQMIGIYEATLLTNNMEAIHSLDSQDNYMLHTKQWEGVKENKDNK